MLLLAIHRIRPTKTSSLMFKSWDYLPGEGRQGPACPLLLEVQASKDSGGHQVIKRARLWPKSPAQSRDPTHRFFCWVLLKLCIRGCTVLWVTHCLRPGGSKTKASERKRPQVLNRDPKRALWLYFHAPLPLRSLFPMTKSHWQYLIIITNFHFNFRKIGLW